MSEESDSVYDSGLFYGGVTVCVGAVTETHPRAFGDAVARCVIAGGGVPAGISFATSEPLIESPRHYECLDVFGCLRGAYRGF